MCVSLSFDSFTSTCRTCILDRQLVSAQLCRLLGPLHFVILFGRFFVTSPMDNVTDTLCLEF